MENTQEIRKDIKGYEGLYQISSTGKVKSLSRAVLTKGGSKRITTEKNIKIRPDLDGYSVVCIYKNDIQKTKKVHRLVAEAFVQNLETKPQINHKNGIRNDNRMENLERCTHSENMIHKFRVLKYRNHLLDRTGSKNTSSLKRAQYTLDGKLIKIRDSAGDIIRALGIDGSSVGRCCLGKKGHKTAGGYIRKYA